MKKNRFFWASAAIAALTLTACADQDEFNQNDVQTAAVENAPGAIQFGTYLGAEGTTRAEIPQTYEKGTIGNKTDAVLGLTELKAAQFGVFGYYTGSTDYREAVGTWGTTYWKGIAANLYYPNFFFNQKVYFDDATGKNAWVYEPVKYWPNGIDKANDDTNPNVDNDPSNTAIQKEAGKLSFFAFAPYMELGTTTALVGTVPVTPATVTANDVKTPFQIDLGSGNVKNGVVAISNNTSPTDVWVRYLLPSANADDAVDLLWGLSGKNAYRETDAANPAKTIGSDYNENLTKQIVGERVKFLFKHALAKLGGSTANGAESLEGDPIKCGLKVVADVDYNSDQPKVDGQSKQGSDYFPTDFNRAKTLITLKEVKIQDGNSINTDTELDWISGMTGKLLNHGWFDIETGKWCEDDGTYGDDGNGAVYNVKAVNSDKDLTDNTSYSINAEIREPDSSTEVDAIKKPSTFDEWVGDNTMNKPKGVDIGTPKPVFANENVPALVFIPTGKDDGSVKQTIYVTVDYLVRTIDPNLSKGYSEVEQVITNEVILDGVNLDPNKYYTLIMHLGMTSVKFEAVVTDWASNTGAEFNEDGTITEQGDENAEVVWLPSNVVNENVLATLEQKAKEPANYFSNKAGQTKILTFKYNGAEITDYDNLTVKSGLPGWLTYDASSHTFTTVSTGTADNQTATVVMQYVHTAGGKTTTITQDINVVRYGTNGLVVTATPGSADGGKMSYLADKENVKLTVSLRGNEVTGYAVDVPTADPDWLVWDTDHLKTKATNTGAERTKTVTVSYSDGVYGDYTATIDITQAAAQLVATTTAFTMAKEAGSQSAELTVNFNGTDVTNDIEVVIPSSVEAWLQYDNVAKKFVAVTENTSGAARPTTAVDVTIKYNGLSITVTVQQLNS